MRYVDQFFKRIAQGVGEMVRNFENSIDMWGEVETYR